MQTFKTTIPSWEPDVAQFFTSDSWPTVANWVSLGLCLAWAWHGTVPVVSWRMKSHHFPEVQTDCIWCEQDNGADTGPTCAHLAMIKIQDQGLFLHVFTGLMMFDVANGKWTFPSMENSMHLSRTVQELQWWQRVFWNSSFRLRLRVLNLMAMFDTMSGPLSKHHVAQREVVASFFFNLSCEDWGEIGQKLIGSDVFISHWGPFFFGFGFDALWWLYC